TLEGMGIDPISSHHEASHSQHEIDLRHEDALTTADNILTFRLITKEIGQLNNIHASFMPKPFADQNGSGMHIHQSLFKEDKNIFFDKNNKYFLSKTCENYIAGLLKHSHEFFAITNQWINSYKRLVHGFESPTHATWSITNPASLIRIPNCKAEKPNSMRIELRNPDPACNPYLALSVILAAGLKGIDDGYKLPEPLEGNKVSGKNRPLPSQLHEALKHFEKSKLMKEALGEYIHNKFIENKQYELDKFNSYITDYEINEYLPIL
ncbi:glutamine synthetase family protein, partial [Spirochaetota bacterium]